MSAADASRWLSRVTVALAVCFLPGPAGAQVDWHPKDLGILGSIASQRSWGLKNPELIGAFPGYGIYRTSGPSFWWPFPVHAQTPHINLSRWELVHGLSPEAMTAGRFH